MALLSSHGIRKIDARQFTNSRATIHKLTRVDFTTHARQFRNSRASILKPARIGSEI